MNPHPNVPVVRRHKENEEERHFGRIAGMAELKRLTGARLVVSEQDNEPREPAGRTFGCQDAGEGVGRRAYTMTAPPGMAVTVTGNSRPWRVTVRPAMMPTVAPKTTSLR